MPFSPGAPGDGFVVGSGRRYAFTGGVVAAIGARARGYVSYRYAESLNMGIGDRLSLGVFGAAGLSEGSPDVVTGLRIGLSLD